MYNVYQAEDGSVWKSDGIQNDGVMANMIHVLEKPELQELFTKEEKMMIAMNVKAYIMNHAKSTIYQVHDDYIKGVLEEEEHGRRFHK